MDQHKYSVAEDPRTSVVSLSICGHPVEVNAILMLQSVLTVEQLLDLANGLVIHNAYRHRSSEYPMGPGVAKSPLV